MTSIKVKYISRKTILFIGSIAQAEAIDLNILESIEKAKALPRGWIIKISMGHKRRPAMTGRTMYIACKLRNPQKRYQAFVDLCGQSLKTRHTAAGAGNILLLLYAVGFVSDDSRIKGLEHIITFIKGSTYQLMTRTFIESFNRYFDNEKGAGELNENSFNFFDKIAFRQQYAEDYDHPVQLLRLLFSMKRKIAATLENIALINPIPKMAIAEFGFPVNTNQKKFNAYLENNRDQIALWGHCFIDTHGKQYPFIKKKSIELFIHDWANTGKYIFYRIYRNPSFLKNEGGIKKQLPSLFNNFLFPQFFEAGVENEILKNVQFKADLSSIGGWMCTLKRGKADWVLNESSVELLASMLSGHLETMAVDMPDYISDHKDRYITWLDNMHYNETQYALQLLTISMLFCNNKTWKCLEKNFKSLCFQIKLFYYGGFMPSHIATNFANHLTCLLVNISGISDENAHEIDRLISLSGYFANIIGYPWVTITERQPMVWDAINCKSNDAFAELEFIIKKLQLAGPVQRRAIAPLYEAIAVYQTVPWPVH